MTLKEQVAELAKSQATQTELLEHIKKSLDKLDHHMHGNGKPGLLIRVDRLETYHRLRTTLLWLLGSTTIGGIVTYIVRVLP